MSWKNLLQKPDETVTLPWFGGGVLMSSQRCWRIQGKLPREHGWYAFKIDGREASDPQPAEPQIDLLLAPVTGYLVGDRIIADNARVDPNPKSIVKVSERVFCIDPGLDRFTRVRVGRTSLAGPLFFHSQEMPLGPEEAVLQAYLDRLPSVDHVFGVTPALDAAFRMETFQRSETERRRRELEQRRREEEERLAREARRAELVQKLGDGAGRREMALHDFAAAARAALAIGGAEYLDHKYVGAGRNHREFAVKYRLDGARYECVCDDKLHITDAGICLTSHEDGEKGDRYFTLESLPGVVRQARREGVLVVYRHV